MLFKKIAIAAALAAISSAASAATVQQVVDLTGNAGLANSHNITAGDLSVTVTGHSITSDGNLSQDRYVGLWSNGLGVLQKGRTNDDHRVDGAGPDEMVLFDFSETVTLERIVFSYADSYDRFSLATYDFDGTDFNLVAGSFSSGLTISELARSGSRWNGGGGDLGFADLTASQQITSALFGIGAGSYHTEFKINSITVSYDDTPPGAPNPVPLPAGGMLLLSGFAAMAVARRRKRA